MKRYPDVWIGLISHLRKAPNTAKSFESGKMPTVDDIRGSGSIKQIAFDIIAFARDTVAAEEVARNTVEIMILKCRWNGNTGPAGAAAYDTPTGRMKSATAFVKVVQMEAQQSFTPKPLVGKSNESPAF